jgi:hypothetical protein
MWKYLIRKCNKYGGSGPSIPPISNLLGGLFIMALPLPFWLFDTELPLGGVVRDLGKPITPGNAPEVFFILSSVIAIFGFVFVVSGIRGVFINYRVLSLDKRNHSD